MPAMTKEEQARKELSDFLNIESERPYNYSNWDFEERRKLGPYEQRKSLSDRYLALPSLDETQEIDPVKPRNYRWVIALAFLTAFSISYCSNSRKVPKEELRECETVRQYSSSNYEPPSFRQGPKK